MSEQLNLKKIEAEADYKKESYDTRYANNKIAQDESAEASSRLKYGVINNLSREGSRYATGLDDELAQLGDTAMLAAASEHYLKYSEKKATEHYQENKDAYRELALIDAHKEGMVINVEQPLEVGHKVDVRMIPPPVDSKLPSLLKLY